MLQNLKHIIPMQSHILPVYASVCFCRMEAEEYVKVIKLALVKKGQTSTVFKTFEVFKKKVLRIEVI